MSESSDELSFTSCMSSLWVCSQVSHLFPPKVGAPQLPPVARLSDPAGSCRSLLAWVFQIAICREHHKVPRVLLLPCPSPTWGHSSLGFGVSLHWKAHFPVVHTPLEFFAYYPRFLVKQGGFMKLMWICQFVKLAHSSLLINQPIPINNH